MICKKGICYWITGLSGSGKSTLSKELAGSIRKNHNNIVLLDGDELRLIFNNKSFNSVERLKISYKYSQTAQMLLEQGIHVIIAVMSLFHEIQSWNRENIENYVEVFLDVPLFQLQERDPKGLYSKFKKGEIKNIVGLDIKSEFPKNPDFHFKWENNESLKKNTNLLLDDFNLRIKK